MFDEAAEIQLVPGGATIRVLRSWAPGASEGRRIAASEAAAIAEVLLSGSAASFGFRELVQRLLQVGNRDPRPALARLLMDEFVTIAVADTRGLWLGPGVRPREDRPTPGPELPRREPGWVAVSVVDADEPGRSFAGAQFRLRLPDNSLRSDALDDAGGVRVEDVTSGRCWFELTDVPRTPGAPG
ncbi:hypothetical protein OV090_09860 [Nannocystis sp. RBIL2]|uniref:hypothetical protein n=1 Tax=Nannocystis sp. RBIL2 TaxID=2996788 RepID=UPI00227036D6|nr:hypothetical protein [Nannocystis sp. RBIL2]MCY1065066.1 hypothetical protein [Nannocystis sp. RBIL2]